MNINKRFPLNNFLSNCFLLFHHLRKDLRLDASGNRSNFTNYRFRIETFESAVSVNCRLRFHLLWSDWNLKSIVLPFNQASSFLSCFPIWPDRLANSRQSNFSSYSERSKANLGLMKDRLMCLWLSQKCKKSAKKFRNSKRKFWYTNRREHPKYWQLR